MEEKHQMQTLSPLQLALDAHVTQIWQVILWTATYFLNYLTPHARLICVDSNQKKNHEMEQGAEECDNVCVVKLLGSHRCFLSQKSSVVVEHTDSSRQAARPDEHSQSSRGSNTCQMQRDVSGWQWGIRTLTPSLRRHRKRNLTGAGGRDRDCATFTPLPCI